MNIPVEEISEPEFYLSVDGEPWKRVASLDSSSPDDRVFMVDRETGKIKFGDGVHGKIPPIGSRIKATYGYGGGSEGNVKGSAITLAWTSTSLLEKQIIGAIIEPQVDGIIFRVCREFEGSRRWKWITSLCKNEMLKDEDREGCVKLSLTDLVLSVLPWPFHKDLPEGYCGENSENTLWDLFLLVLRKSAHNSLGDREKNGSQYVSKNQRKKISSSECSNKGKATKKNYDNNEEVAGNKQRVYVVKGTDTLQSIAQSFYHDPEKWREIAEANGIENPRLLTTGTTINIPALDE